MSVTYRLTTGSLCAQKELPVPVSWPALMWLSDGLGGPFCPRAGQRFSANAGDAFLMAASKTTTQIFLANAGQRIPTSSAPLRKKYVEKNIFSSKVSRREIIFGLQSVVVLNNTYVFCRSMSATLIKTTKKFRTFRIPLESQ